MTLTPRDVMGVFVYILQTWVRVRCWWTWVRTRWKTSFLRSPSRSWWASSRIHLSPRNTRWSCKQSPSSSRVWASSVCRILRKSCPTTCMWFDRLSRRLERYGFRIFNQAYCLMFLLPDFLVVLVPTTRCHRRNCEAAHSKLLERYLRSSTGLFLC